MLIFWSLPVNMCFLQFIFTRNIIIWLNVAASQVFKVAPSVQSSPALPYRRRTDWTFPICSGRRRKKKKPENPKNKDEPSVWKILWEGRQKNSTSLRNSTGYQNPTSYFCHLVLNANLFWGVMDSKMIDDISLWFSKICHGPLWKFKV